ncbi:pilus (MSHA type) biogenesis protein MshL [Chitinibacter sp. ZOR0017]|uniref:pilus (MSHA type) biogenesis protein MshL n=1 Tax=Chitinibacter sp. ZOR0017 TaxID=1339254 RepID=UPI00068DB98E|nr:pilus (MSHA type) biogenesis protein MshL [Chitinibacter sp. ZOR0017]
MRQLALAIGIGLLAGCAGTTGLSPVAGRHLQASAVAASDEIPAPVKVIPYLPQPAASTPLETYSVVVSQLPVHNLLFALARDARINVDVHPEVQGVVTLNAINQTLPQILTRIARQVDIHWRFEQGVLTVMPDRPYLQTYKVDYFNLSRNMKANVAILNSVTTGGQTGTNSGGNSSTTSIDSENPHQFWKRLETNLKEMLGIRDGAPTSTSLTQPVLANVATQLNQTLSQKTTDTKTAVALTEALSKAEKNAAEAGKSRAEQANVTTVVGATTVNIPANQVIMNPESGTISVRATHKDQQKVAEFLSLVQASAQRQVMIEATIVEVALGDQYQAGVDWSRIASGSGWSLGQSLVGANLGAAPMTYLSYKGSNFTATLKLLEQFGRTRVLSSPKVIALNNQTAVMKVVEEQVYFTLQLEEDKNTDGVVTGRTYTSTLHTVPVGLVMQVTPQVAETGLISMNVRPTITNISSYVEDPAVALISRNSDRPVQSLVPVLQVREFDSTLKIASGQSAVLGGLIQDKLVTSRQGVPGLSRVPVLGDAFSYRDDKVSKIELVVFLRPIVVREQGLAAEQASDQRFLPGDDFFQRSSDQELSAFQGGLVPLPAKARAQ